MGDSSFVISFSGGNKVKLNLCLSLAIGVLFVGVFNRAAIAAEEKLILFGGGGYTPAAIAKFVSFAGGKEARIVILPWATSEPIPEFKELEEQLAGYEPASVIRGLAPDSASFNKGELLHQLETATGIFFPGGDQIDLMERINKYPEVRDLLLRVYHNGVVFAGYSAGTAIASKTMITGRGNFSVIDPTEVETGEGLGLVTKFIIDQHFIVRQRQNRLMSVLQVSSESIGIGIDEGMALLVENEVKGTVIGNGYVMVFRRQKSPTRFTVDLLKNNQTILIP